MESLGRYIGREIRLVMSFEDSAEVPALAVDGAVVLVWLNQLYFPNSRVSPLFKRLVSRSPLALLLGGSGACEAFDVVLRLLADVDCNAKHTMTKWSPEPMVDCVSELLQSTWPADERFDEWVAYAIACDERDADAIRRATSQALHAG